jgi:hypothetical protein
MDQSPSAQFTMCQCIWICIFIVCSLLNSAWAYMSRHNQCLQLPFPVPLSFGCPSVDSSSSSFSSLAPLLCSGSSGNRSEGEAGIYFQVCMLICSQEARRRWRIMLFLDFIWHLGPRATHAMSMGKQQRIPGVPDACFLRSSSIPLNLFSSTLFLVDPPCFLGRFDSSNLSHSPFLLLGPGGVSGGLSILAKLFCWWRPVLKLVNKESNSGQQQRCVAVFL